jgi:hypothetical protein
VEVNAEELVEDSTSARRLQKEKRKQASFFFFFIRLELSDTQVDEP